MADIFNIAGEINSTSQEGTAVHANQVKDDLHNKKQSQINEEVGEELELHTNRLNALTGQNYITVQATQSTTAADIPTLINASGEGEQADTLYRVGFWDGSAYVADKYTEYAWNGTAYVILDVKSSIGEIFDISQYNAVGGTLTPYADLAAALGVDGENVPSSVRRGGMSIKFVQTSGNKYVSYRLTKDEWSTDTEDWAIADEGVYVDNPEFVYVKTDAEGKILCAIKADGNIYFGAGVPLQVIEYIQQKIDELSLDEYEDIVDFLNGLEEGENTLQQLFDEKLDAEGLEPAALSTMDSIENPEWIDVKTDSEDKILEGIRSDGTKVIELPVKVQDGKYLTVDNLEWIKVFTDKEDKIIYAIDREGSVYCPVGLTTSNLKTINISFDEAAGSSLALKSIHIGNSGLLAFQEDLIASGFGQKRILNYKKYRAIGDSLTNASNWINLVKDYLSIDSIVRSGSVGLCMADVPGTNSIHQAIMALTQDDELDLISIWAGTNDYNASIPLGDFDTQYNAAQRDTATFYGAYMESVEHLLNTFPHARLFLIGTTDRVSRAYNSSDPWNDAKDGNLTKYVDATKKVAEQYSLPFLDLLRTSGINKYNIGQYMYLQTYPADNPTIELYLHFNGGFGMQSIAKRIASFINSIG